MDDRFLRAWITRRDWRVCGQRLQPLCLGHLVNLEAINSPLRPEADDIDLRVSAADLLLAARICSETWPHPGRLRPRLRDILWRIFLDRRPGLLRHHVYRFDAYYRDHTSYPEFWSDESGCARSLTAPAALSKAAFLISETSITEARAWSMPLARVDYTISAIIERRSGDLRFLQDGDEEEIEQPEDTLTEAEIIATAKAALPPDRFAEWMKAREKAKGEKRKGKTINPPLAALGRMASLFPLFSISAFSFFS